MQKLAIKFRAAGMEHSRTRAIREIVALTAKRAKSARMSAVGKGYAISLVERKRRAAVRTMTEGLKPKAPVFPTTLHCTSVEPWERLADAVVAAWQ